MNAYVHYTLNGTFRLWNNMCQYTVDSVEIEKFSPVVGKSILLQ